MNEVFEAPPVVGSIQRRSLIIGVTALAICGIGAIFQPDQFLRSYLTGYLFYIGVALGSLALVMLHHLAGGAWGLVIRRLLESATRTLPLLAILFLPLALGIQRLYTWSRPELFEHSEAMLQKHAYLNIGFFLARAVFYFAVWLVLARFLNRWSREQDVSDNSAVGRRLQALSAPGLVLYVLTVTFAAIDWVMSLDPEWFSTIYGLLIMAGEGLSAMAFVIAAAVFLGNYEPMTRVFSARHFHDLGKLMLMFTMVWAYFNFSQLLITWEGNLTEEIPWYLRRWQSGWQWVGILLIVFHFALPFLLLLSRELKRSRTALGRVAAVVLVMRFVDLFWLTTPEFYRDSFHIHWMDFLMPVALGGIWLAFFARQLGDRPLIPLYEPHFEEAVAKHGHD